MKMNKQRLGDSEDAQINCVLKKHSRFKRRQKTISALALLVFVLSICGMTRPAITMDRESFCGQSLEAREGTAASTETEMTTDIASENPESQETAVSGAGGPGISEEAGKDEPRISAEINEAVLSDTAERGEVLSTEGTPKDESDRVDKSNIDKSKQVIEPERPKDSAAPTISGETYSSSVTAEKSGNYYSIYDSSANRRVLDPQGHTDAEWSLCLNRLKNAPGTSDAATGEYIKIVNPTEAQYAELSGDKVPGNFRRVKRILYAKAALYPNYSYGVFQNELYYVITGMAKYDTNWGNDALNAQKLQIRAVADGSAYDADIESGLQAAIYQANDSKLQNTITAAFNNPPPSDTASLTVKKLVGGDGGERDRDFHFTLYLYGVRRAGVVAVPPLSGTYVAERNGVYETIAFDASGKAAFTLKHNESLTITGIEKGFYYKIAELEADSDGYATTVDRPSPTGQYDPGGDFNNFDSYGGVTSEVSIVFTNNKRALPPPPDKISIPVAKVWNGAPTDSVTVRLMADGVEVASQTLSERNNWQYVFADLDKYNSGGTRIMYTLAEDEVYGYETVITGGCDYGACGFTITNTEIDTAELTIQKFVAGAGDRNKDFHFRVNLVDGGANALSGEYRAFRNGVPETIIVDSLGNAEVVLKHNENIRITGLPRGFYFIVVETEADLDGYTTTVDRPNPDEQDDEIAGVNNYLADSGVEANTVVTFTNHKDGPAGYQAEIKARKTLDGGLPQDRQFTFILTDADGREAGRQSNDAAGNVTFRLDLPAPGVYEYALRELNDGQGGITYDEHIYSVQITVTAPATPGGQPQITVSYDNVPEPAEFQNLYGYLLPETGGMGIDGYIGGGAALILASLLSLYIIKLVRRKEGCY